MNRRIALFILLISYAIGCKPGLASGPKEGSALPELTMRLIDTTAVFHTSQIKKGSPFVIIYFSPDCSHCREETRQLVSHMDLFRNVRFLFLTPNPYDDLAYFYKEFRLGLYANITVGQDNHLSFYHYFNPIQIPYTAIYNGDKKLNEIIVGFGGIDHILQSIRS